MLSLLASPVQHCAVVYMPGLMGTIIKMLVVVQLHVSENVKIKLLRKSIYKKTTVSAWIEKRTPQDHSVG